MSHDDELRAIEAEADAMPEPQRTAFLRSKLDELNQKYRSIKADADGMHDWRSLIATCLRVSDEDEFRKEAARRLEVDGGHLTASERLRIAAKFGQRIASEIDIGRVSDLVTFWDMTGEAIKTNGGYLAGVPVSAFKNRDIWEIGQEPLHRAAQWARAGFNEFRPSDGLTAALLLTEVPRIDPDELHLPFDCFAVRLPQGLIPFFVPDAEGSRREWCELLWVARYSNKFGTRIRLWVDWRGLTVTREYAEDWATQYKGGDEDIANEDEIALDACFRLLRNFLLWIDDRGGMKAQRPESVPKKLQEKRQRSGDVWPTSWVFGREVALRPELRRAAAEAALGRSKRHAVEGWEVRARFAVRGHWRHQAHGPGRALRRRQWIAPFWKGPETGEAFAHIYRDSKVES